uniref:TLDc domain-containing protein n=1 Tax=Magallana gigas TaxID=29159 RepID=A0A8W8LPR2_MAGGI
MAIPINKEEMETLHDMIGGGKFKFTLLYKVSRDGCNAWTFHTKCDSQGPTITVIYNTKDTVYGGYTSQSWLGAGAEFGAHDEKAFLFQVRYNGKSVNNKFQIKADKYPNATACHHSLGPVFGKGDPAMPFFSGKVNASNGVFNFTAGKIGNIYDMKSTDIATFTNDSTDVRDLEVYKVDDGELQQSFNCWRITPKFDNQYLQNLKRDVEEYTPLEETNVDQVKILLTGQVKAGKSSFINTIISIFKGAISSQAPSGSTGKSLTTKFKNYDVKKGRKGQPMNFKLCDTKGLEIDDGIDPVEFCYILDGNMPDNADSPGFVSIPSLKDKIHIVVIVMDATSIDIFPPAIVEKLKVLQAKVNQRGIPQVVLLTQIDLRRFAVGRL